MGGRTTLLLLAAWCTSACGHASRTSTASPAASARASATAPAATFSATEYPLTNNYAGSACLPQGDVITLKGKLSVEPFGKGTDGVRLITAEGDRWILSYRAEGVLLELNGKQVSVRGRACAKQLEAILGRHFDATRVSVE